MEKPSVSPEITQIAVAAASSWLTMMSLAFIGALAVEASRGHASLGEFALLFVPIMTVPLALVLGAIYLPALLIAKRTIGRGATWVLAATGAAAGPLAGLALLAAGRILFSGSPHMRPSFRDDLAALARDPVHTLPYALALIVGGIVFGATMGRPRFQTRSAVCSDD